jgi:integrase/recombinase XerC
MLSVDSFLDYLRLERNYSDKTIESYRNDLTQLEQFIKESPDTDLEMENAGHEEIREWIVWLMENGYNANSVNRKLSALRSFYKYLLKRGVISVDPMRKISCLKKSKPLPYFLKEDEANAAIDGIDYEDNFIGQRDRMIIEMFYATGIRESELINLDDADINLDSSTLKVTGKRNKQRIIPFDEELKSDIQHYIYMRNNEVVRDCDALFTTGEGKRLNAHAVYSLVKKNLSKVTALKKRSPHVLRHTFATAMLNNEAELNAVKELLGHESLATTQIYTHTTFESLKKTYKQAHPRA